MPNKQEETKDKAEEKDPRRKAAEDKIASDRQAEMSVLNKHGYKVLQSVGKGSFADVRMAFSSTQKKNIAVKIISKDKITDKDFVRKFVPREIRVLRQLNHPNIIKFYKSIETLKTIFIFMELAHNGDLLQIIKKEKVIDEKRACRWFHHLVDGVAHLHSRGIAHRDLKCENLLLDKYFVIKITDFGFTRDGLPVYLTDGQTENEKREKVLSSTFCGSFAYASPEILKGIPYEPNLSDVWSMGVVLYIMVFGRLPFDDTTWNGLLKQVSEPVAFPSTPEISDSCKTIIKDILSPLNIRMYIPQIRKHQWYTKTWDIHLDRMYQRKYRWEVEEKSKVFDQTIYKGKGKDITKYERAATLRRYISEKEKLGHLRRMIKGKESKLEEIKVQAAQGATSTETSAQQPDTKKNDLTPLHKRKTASENVEVSSEHLKSTSRHSVDDPRPFEKPTTGNATKLKTEDERTLKDNNSANDSKKDQVEMASKEVSSAETPCSAFSVKELTAPLPAVQTNHNEIPININENIFSVDDTSQQKSERYFKDINEAILERNTQLANSQTASRTKEISSHKFCRREDGSRTEGFGGVAEESDTLKETFATDMVPEIEGDEDIEVVQMPDTLEEQEVKQVELKSDSHSEFLQLIEELEQDADLENEELIAKCKRIFQEEEEEEANINNEEGNNGEKNHTV